MINFNEYYSYLEKEAMLSNHYYREFENLARSAKYMRCNRVVKKYQKDLERKKAASSNILNNIFKEEQKKNGIKTVVKVNTNKDSKLKLFFRKIFGIKPPVVSGIIEEFSEYPETSSEEPKKPEIEAVAIANEELEEYDDEFYDLEEGEDFQDDYHCDDTIEGQMDIEELNEGDVYEKEES